jgi:hypothetical protein
VVRERAVGEINKVAQKVEPWEHCSEHREEAQKMLAALLRGIEHAAGGDLAGPIVYCSQDCSLRRRRKEQRSQARLKQDEVQRAGPGPIRVRQAQAVTFIRPSRR